MEHATFKRAILYVAGLLLFTAVMGFATSDSCTFARMYMSVNNQTDGDHTYQAIHVSPFSPMEICTDTELVASIQNGYTGYIYLGSPRCPLLPEYSAPLTGAGSDFRYQQDFVVHFAKLQLPL